MRIQFFNQFLPGKNEKNIVYWLILIYTRLTRPFWLKKFENPSIIGHSKACLILTGIMYTKKSKWLEKGKNWWILNFFVSETFNWRVSNPFLAIKVISGHNGIDRNAQLYPFLESIFDNCNFAEFLKNDFLTLSMVSQVLIDLQKCNLAHIKLQNLSFPMMYSTYLWLVYNLAK